MLLYGIIFAALTVAATPSGARAVVPSAPALTFGAPPPLMGDARGGSAALMQFLERGGLCRWHPPHGHCPQSVKAQGFCDRRPDHHLCADPDEDRFCRRRPDHHLCADADDNRFCRRRADHPLCDDDRFCRKRADHPRCDDPPSSS